MQRNEKKNELKVKVKVKKVKFDSLPTRSIPAGRRTVLDAESASGFCARLRLLADRVKKKKKARGA